jgi:hypothetical protein
MAMLNKNQQFNVDMKYREEVLTSITKRIEEKFGILKPSVYEYREYERKQTQINDRILNIKHFAVTDFPDWEQFLLKGITLKDDLDDISSDENEHMVYRDGKK